jgi:hypothetical protein
MKKHLSIALLLATAFVATTECVRYKSKIYNVNDTTTTEDIAEAIENVYDTD